MSSHTALRVESGDVTWLHAPAVGLFWPAVRPGDVVATGTALGEFQVLGTRWVLRAPEMAPARVVEVTPRARLGVAWSAPLLRVEALGLDSSAGESTAASATADGLVAFRAQMEGQFYRATGPDVPPFAQPGDVVQPGATIGLIEVMKFFYPVVWNGLAAVRLVRFDAVDARPIEAGAVIAWLEPVER